MERPCFLLLWIQTCWHFSGCQNIALNKPTTMINTRLQRLSERAVDGNLNRSDVYYCTHTDSPVPNIPMWWTVDLLSRYTVSNVKILNRLQYGYRLNDFSLTLWDVDPASNLRADENQNYCICAHYPGTLPTSGLINIPCTKDCTGRFFTVLLKGSTILTLCEVEVYGQPANELARNGAIFRKIPNKRMNGTSSNSYWESTKTSLQCSMYCLKDIRCIGYNYRSYIGDNNCLVLTATVHLTEDFIFDADWVLVTIRLLI